MDFGFCGASYTAASPIIDDERAVNVYLERSESGKATTPIALIGRPGRVKFCVLPESKVPNSFSVNGRTFFAASNLYEVSASGAVTNRGSIGSAPVLPTQLTANETQLVVLNNGNLYVFTLATNILTAVNMAQFNGPVQQIDQIDGYIVATLQTSHTFQQSNLEDATTWSGLNISTISYFPDNIVSMKADHRELWFWSGKRAIGYYNAGAGFPVFIPIQGAQIEHGSGATFATVAADNTMLWLDQDEKGSMIARRLEGQSSEKRVSTHATELAWQSYAINSDAVGYTLQFNGHLLWLLYFPTASATWVYDISQDLWTEWGYWLAASGTYIADRGMCHTFNFGRHLVGDWASGNVYELNTLYYDDDGNPIRGNRRTPTLSKENERLFFEKIEFVLETGLTPDPPFQGQAGTTVITLQAPNGTLYGFAVDDNGLIEPTAPGDTAQTIYLNDVTNGSITWLLGVTNNGLLNPTQVTFNASFENGLQLVSIQQDKYYTLAITANRTIQLTAAGLVGRPAQLMLRWSNNGGKTWSNWFYLNCGFAGEYDTRAVKRMLGKARKRLWDVAWTDPIPWRFSNAFLKAEAEI